MKNEESAGKRTQARARPAARKSTSGRGEAIKSTGSGSAGRRSKETGRTGSKSTGAGRTDISASASTRGRDPSERAEDLRAAERRKRRELEREKRDRSVRRQKIMFAAVAVVIVLLFIGGTSLFQKAWANSTLSEDVLSYKKTVEKYAKREKIQDYTDTLLAIMMVESEGKGSDVMQSSESKGLERNSLGPEESIEQACIYFAALIDIADDLEIKDDKALIQAYNFGPGYLVYVSKNGKKHKEQLAEEYAKEHSGGEKVRFLHVYAIKKNGGWIYKFGNMFYEAIVEQYL